MPSTSILTKGTLIGHYRIVDKIGSGGMGEVYLAEDIGLSRKVALKFLPSDCCRDELLKARFLREAQAAAKIRHPNIITLYEINSHDNQPFFAMEYIEGKPLDAYAKEQACTLKEILDISLQVADGLAEAHRCGIIHRDLKPGNIMVDSDGRVRILDFGLAAIKGTDKLTDAGTIVGTVNYMSPEQTKGEPLDQRSDIFSLGVVLYEMIAEQVPFHGEHKPAVMYSIAYEDPEPLARYKAGIPDGIQRIVGKMLAKNPSDRYQSAGDLSVDLRSVLVDETSALSRPRRPDRWNKMVVTTAAAVLLVVAGYWAMSSLWAPKTAPSGRKMLGVLPFRVIAPKPEWKEWPEIIQTMIAGDLTGVSECGIVDPLSLNALISDEYGSSNPSRDLRLYRLAQKKGISYLVDGDIMGIDSGVRIQASVIDATTGEQMTILEQASAGEPDLPRAVRTLSRNLFDFFQTRELQSGYSRDLQPWTAHRSINMAALKAFMQATQFIYLEGSGSERYLRQAIEMDSAFAAPRIWLIPGLVERGAIDEAKSQYQMLLRYERDANPFEQAMINWAGAYISGDKRAQLAALQAALDYSPANNILLYHLARTQFILGDHKGVIQTLTPAIEMRWKYSQAYYLVGASQCALGEFDQARKTLKSSLSLPVVYPYTYGLLSALAAHQADSLTERTYEESFVNELRGQQVPLGQIYAMLGENHMNIGTCASAIRCYRLAVSLNPEDADTHANLGEALQCTGKSEQAEHEYIRAIALDSMRAFSYRMLGGLYEQRGDTNEAVRWYRAYIARDSTSPHATEIARRLSQLRQ